MACIKIALNNKSATCSCVPNCFYFGLWAELAEMNSQSYKKWSFFSVFMGLSTFPQVFGQVKEWLFLELHKIIRVSHVGTCPIAFLFYELSWQGGVLIVMKNDHF